MLRRIFTLLAGVSLMVFGIVGLAAPATAGNKGKFPQNFNRETAAGFTNTFTSPGTLTPSCPLALAGTPGSDPATKVLNQALNTAGSFLPGGTVHYTYLDNPHTNGGTNNFAIQDCVVVYPAGFFPPGSIDPITGVVSGGVTKAQLGMNGTALDGAILNGILSPSGNIYYNWTAPSSVTAGEFVCNFARDIDNNHFGSGNRKVTPTCFQVATPQTPNVPNTPTVFVGYADRAHSGGGPTPTPTPWNGSANTIFVGCDPTPPGDATCATIDAGAMMVTNTNTGPGGVGPGDPITVSNVSVTIGPCVWQQWPGTYTVPSGQSLILTQTDSLTAGPGPSQCTQALQTFNNFDTSEEPGETADPSTVICTNNGLIPSITMTVQNTTAATSITTSQQILDSGQVLNTGGLDVGDCPTTAGGVEAHAWTEVL